MSSQPRGPVAAYGNRIRQLRLDKGWRQMDLAERAGLNQVLVSEVELAKRSPWSHEVRRIAKALGVRPEDLFRP